MSRLTSNAGKVTMLLNAYNPATSQSLATTAATTAAQPARAGQHTVASELIDVGGDWRRTNWRTEVRRLAHTFDITAIVVRTEPGEPQLTTSGWVNLARAVTRRANVADRSWASIRTAPNAVTILIPGTVAQRNVQAARSYANALVNPRRPGRPDPAATAQLSFTSRPVQDSQTLPPTNPNPPGPPSRRPSRPSRQP